MIVVHVSNTCIIDFTEQDNCIGVMGANDQFVPHTNFTFTFVCKVMSPTQDYSGFIVKVLTSSINGRASKG